MPDGDTTTPGQEPTSTTTTPESGSGRSIDAFPEEAQDYIRRLREENAKHRNERKAQDTRLKEFEDAQKTEEQKRAERVSTAEGRATSAESKLAKYEAAAEAGLPLKYAARLQGATKDELLADAKQLAQDFGLTPGEGGEPASGGSGFDGGVRRPVQKPKTMNGVIRSAAGY